MSRKQVGRNTGKSGRIDLSGSELDKFGVDVGDAVDAEVVDAKAVAHALIDSEDAEEFGIVTPDL